MFQPGVVMVDIQYHRVTFMHRGGVTSGKHMGGVNSLQEARQEQLFYLVIILSRLTASDALNFDKFPVFPYRKPFSWVETHAAGHLLSVLEPAIFLFLFPFYRVRISSTGLSKSSLGSQGFCSVPESLFPSSGPGSGLYCVAGTNVPWRW